MNIVDLIAQHTGHTYRKKTQGGEYCGPCPWCAGDDRFEVWNDDNPRYWCRVCNRKGDAIQFLRDYAHLPFAQAKEQAAAVGLTSAHADPERGERRSTAAQPAGDAPGGLWQERGRAFVRDAHKLLFGPDGARALAWLQGRGLSADTLQRHGVGYNPADCWEDRAAWGLDPEQDKHGRPKRVWLPRGVVIPWIAGDDLWGVNIRRPTKPGDEYRYHWIPGGTRGLYKADTVRAGLPAVITEGELDALTIIQAAGNLAAVVATGSTQGARRARWIARLGTAAPVLVAFDADPAGEDAAGYWLDALPGARRWRPFWGDANGMAQAGVDIRAWVEAGLSPVTV